MFAGKTIENVRKRVDIKLIAKWVGCYSMEAMVARPNFHSRSIFDENLVAVQLKQTEVTIRKPIYIGMSILDISKTHIYDFYYSFLKAKLGEKCKLLYIDTDSFMISVKDMNAYEFIKNNLDKFDTSDYPEDNIFGIPRVNKKKLGFFKDECNGRIMLRLVILRSKMYAILIMGEDPIKKAKGVKSGVVKQVFTYPDYEQCLFNNVTKVVTQKTIRSRLHVVHTEKQKKVGLSHFDDKRYIIPNTVDTLPWGHFEIPEEAENGQNDFVNLLAPPNVPGANEAGLNNSA